MASVRAAADDEPLMRTRFRRMSASTRADLSTAATALAMVLAQCPQVISLTWKVSMACPFEVMKQL
jgi:hypothetical protein